ncbi:13347_t:CDS:2, partial [Ambispora gerdemannii]
MVETVEKVLDHEELVSLQIYIDESLKHGKLMRIKADILNLLDWLIVCEVIKGGLTVLGAVEDAITMIAMK